MMLWVLLLSIISPAHAILNSEIEVGYKQICYDVWEVQVLVNNAYIETYYEYEDESDYLKCVVLSAGFIDPLEKYSR